MTGTIDLAGKRVAIANRAEIAVRIAATCRRLGTIPIVLLGEPDIAGYAARQIGRVECIGEAGSELEVDRVVAAARRAGADFLHPGYGFLSERADLAEACGGAGIRFVGPSPETLRLCGDKLETRRAAERAGVPVLAASPPLGDDPASWIADAGRIGYPLLVKPAGSGGGRGLRLVLDETALIDAVAASRREGVSGGQDAVVYLERALIGPRHVEVQVVADGESVFIPGDRDCSLQRRHQKVIEEAPAPNVDEETRQKLQSYARKLAVEVGLRGIATCEFLLGPDGELAFLEINPRIQVEHPVTELVTRIDLVEWQLRIAAGEDTRSLVGHDVRGHAVEARIYAEDPTAGFRPSPGQLGAVSWPYRPSIRVDAGYASNDVVPHAYDPMLAKVIAYGADRQAAIDELRVALLDTVIAGVSTNIAWLIALLDSEPFGEGRATTDTAIEIDSIAPNRAMASIAALAYLIEQPRASVTDPWSRLGPWRVSGNGPVTLHGDDWEERFDVCRSPTGWTVQRAGDATAIEWWREAAGVWTIHDGKSVARMAAVKNGMGVEVFGQGGRWVVFPGPLPRLATVQRDQQRSGQVRAPMPASVVAIHVGSGDRVEAGQPLVTLSAMKMEIVCEAPVEGVVESISCTPGDLVTADQELVRIRREVMGSNDRQS
jgi:acetyl/propionyl-CoA carboxylase alpha subunit